MRRLIALVLVIAVGSIVALRFVLIIWRGPATTPRTITIAPGASVTTIAHTLAREGVLPAWWVLPLYVRLHPGAPLRSGRYDIAAGMTAAAAVALLRRGDAGVTNQIRITFPEGWEARQIAARLTARGLPGDAVLALVQRGPDAALRKRYPFLADVRITTLEGFLFPDTYTFARTATPQQILRAFLTAFAQKGLPALANPRGAATAYALYDHVILASIVERESRVHAERATIAGIFYNRLDRGMPLGSDATLEYITQERKVKHTRADTAIASPYNTYKHVGLPPGPISNPGARSLAAAAHPAATPYLYFLNDARTGETVFARTLDEHVRNKRAHGL